MVRMRLTFGAWFLATLVAILVVITTAESLGKSRNREDRFDLENESLNSCESAESGEEYSTCRETQTEYPKRKTFRFAI
ncbi:uncharacterized protein [Drosophila kikkawai]|uniref:Uncharacterized protein n=1 Tax=Drosophila kikkawai TaxID=30033 RepID=A0A6P4HUU9_DROKI|nr:uncharacterized protein LOC108072704 [Drosophila kikkawai]